MRNIILVFAIVFMIGCSKDDHSGSTSSKVTIKGKISGSVTKSTGLKSTVSLGDAKKVLVFNSNGYELFDITDSAFTAKAASGSALALAFLDANSRYIGCLSAGGLNVLPLVSLKDGDNTVIDLSKLTLDGNRVIPANNPIGNEISLTDNEIAWYKQLGTYYESLSTNIDADNDGVPDILSNKELALSTIFDITCGTWGLNTTAPQIIDTANFAVGYTLRVEGGKNITPANTVITFTGPEGLNSSVTNQWNYNVCPDGNFISFFSHTDNSGFLAGMYTMTIESKAYTLNYSNVNSRHFFILAEPTVQTNSNNQVVSVTVTYKDMGNAPVEAENFVYQTMVELDGDTRICEIGKLWEDPSSMQHKEKYTFTLPDPVPLSELKQITVCYEDLIGNAYNLRFTAQVQ